MRRPACKPSRRYNPWIRGASQRLADTKGMLRNLDGKEAPKKKKPLLATCPLHLDIWHYSHLPYPPVIAYYLLCAMLLSMFIGSIVHGNHSLNQTIRSSFPAFLHTMYAHRIGFHQRKKRKTSSSTSSPQEKPVSSIDEPTTPTGSMIMCESPPNIKKQHQQCARRRIKWDMSAPVSIWAAMNTPIPSLKP